MFDSDPYDEWMETINKLGESRTPFPASFGGGGGGERRGS